MEYFLYMPPYLTGIEGPPPKRNVVSSSLAGGAKMTAVSRFSMVYSGFYYHFLWVALPLRRNDFIHFPLHLC